MATIRRIAPSTPQLAFQNVPSQTGAGFQAMADLAKSAYDMVLPDAVKQYEKEGADAARAIAQQQIGEPAAAVAPTNGGGSSISDSLARTESGGNYQAQNKEGYFGKYQWGQARLDDYNRANGTTVTKAEFLSNPGVQEQAQQWAEKDIMGNLNDLIGKSVNGQVMTPAALIAVAHLGGTGGARKYVESNGEYNPADSNGTHLSDYARIHGGAGNVVPPTMIRDADGQLVARLHSPMSEPFRQAYNAAAGIAYNADMQMKATTDLMGISQQFALDPQGYQQAANAYVSELVSKAPAVFQEDLRGSLTNEVQRRSLGILEAQQSDIRQRAENSTNALAEKQSSDYAAAVASGDPREINAAHAALSATLKAKESLPGAAWTPAQSANVFDAAENEGKRAASARDSQAAQRAENAANAIQARQASELSAAVASGDPAKIAAAEGALTATLDQKAKANGSTWTPEQSYNVVAAAKAAGQQAAQQAATTADRETKDKLKGILDMGNSGIVSADQSILNDPEIAKKFPEEVLAARAAQNMAQTMPQLFEAPPADVQHQADLLRKTATSPLQIATINKMDELAKTMAEAYDKDPVAAAIKYRKGNLPPALPDAATMIAAPAAATAMMKARLGYMTDATAHGYNPSGALLSGAESDQWGAMFSKEVPVEARLAAATLVAEGFGDKAGIVFKGLKGADPVTQSAGQFVASGGDAAIAKEAMTGQAMLDAGMSKGKLPAVDISQVDAGYAQALAGLPIPQADIMKLAAGYYAYHNHEPIKDAADAKKAAKDAVNAALGASTDTAGRTTGGIQAVNGQPLLLPSGVRGADVEAVLNGSGGAMGAVGLVGGALPVLGPTALALGYGLSDTAISPAWQSSGLGASKGGPPMMGTVPLSQSQLKETRIIPTPQFGENAYRMEFRGAPVRDSKGGLYVFDLTQLVKGAK
ncbi:MAG: hypothetical protein JWQ44_2919 [Chthoniobacter sp.]|nr:hypothetical protein [Chthoniobacter sp.]